MYPSAFDFCEGSVAVEFAKLFQEKWLVEDQAFDCIRQVISNHIRGIATVSFKSEFEKVQPFLAVLHKISGLVAKDVDVEGQKFLEKLGKFDGGAWLLGECVEKLEKFDTSFFPCTLANAWRSEFKPFVEKVEFRLSYDITKPNNQILLGPVLPFELVVAAPAAMKLVGQAVMMESVDAATLDRQINRQMWGSPKTSKSKMIVKRFLVGAAASSASTCFEIYEFLSVRRAMETETTNHLALRLYRLDPPNNAPMPSIQI